jgi:hypothetical protein
MRPSRADPSAPAWPRYTDLSWVSATAVDGSAERCAGATRRGRVRRRGRPPSGVLPPVFVAIVFVERQRSVGCRPGFEAVDAMPCLRLAVAGRVAAPRRRRFSWLEFIESRLLAEGQDATRIGVGCLAAPALRGVLGGRDERIERVGGVVVALLVLRAPRPAPDAAAPQASRGPRNARKRRADVPPVRARQGHEHVRGVPRDPPPDARRKRRPVRWSAPGVSRRGRLAHRLAEARGAQWQTAETRGKGWARVHMRPVDPSLATGRAPVGLPRLARRPEVPAANRPPAAGAARDSAGSAT